MSAPREAIWMVVDLNNDELPLFIGQSAQDCADFVGTSYGSVMSSVSHAKRRNGKSKFVRVYCDEEE